MSEWIDRLFLVIYFKVHLFFLFVNEFSFVEIDAFRFSLIDINSFR